MSIFTKVASKVPKSSVFNISDEVKTSMNFGDLVPILCKECLPSDRFKMSTELLIKLTPLKSPVMHRIKAYVHFFFVPSYQINGVFGDFINPKVNKNNDIVLPKIDPTSISVYGSVNSSLLCTLSDYLGLPILNSGWLLLDHTSTSRSAKISIDPFRCYQHIYNEYYRDQNLENVFADASHVGLFNVESHLNSVGQIVLGWDANSITALLKLRQRAWGKDYFTSALPSPQAGDDVLIPINNVIEPDGSFEFDAVGPGDGIEDYSPIKWAGTGTGTGTDYKQGNLMGSDSSSNDATLKYKKGLKSKNATATINDLRRAMALQRFKELAERGGTRYTEMVANFFGVKLPDYWVNRPIYLGGQVQPVQIGEVVQTSMSDENTQGDDMYLGERGGIGNSYGRTGLIDFKAPCHGYVMAILSVRPQATYQQGIERMWTRDSIFDFAFPQFAKMGEQEIYGCELCATGGAYDDSVFGFTPRYAEYKVGNCRISGDLRQSLNYWHLGRKFNPADPPTLSKEFVQMVSPSYDAFAVTSAASRHLVVNGFIKISGRRPLPYFGSPSII